MVKLLTPDQAMTVLATLLSNADWSKLDADRLQNHVVTNGQEAGRQFTGFLANDCRLMIGEPKILHSCNTCVFDPTEWPGKDWTVWLGPPDGDGLSGEPDIDSRSQLITDLDMSKALFETMFRQGDPATIKGELKLSRLKETDRIRFGGNILVSAWNDYQTNGENSVLEWLYKNRKIAWFDLPGLILRDPYGRRSVPYFCRRAYGWLRDYDWLERGWHVSNPSGLLASNLSSDLVPLAQAL